MEVEKYGGSKGVFLTGNSEDGFISTKNINIKEYSPSDTSRVGWYYLPIWKKAPVWTDPYENKNINGKAGACGKVGDCLDKLSHFLTSQILFIISL